MPRTLLTVCLIAVLLSAAAGDDAPQRGADAEAALLLRLDKEPKVQDVSQNLPIMVYGPANKDGSRPAYPRSEMLGKRVRVEGLAWGQPFGVEGEKGTISPHVLPHVIHHAGATFIKGIDFTAKKHRGTPVRVTGTLRLASGTHTRFGDVLGYFYIEATTYEPIDAVKEPLLLAAGEE